MMPFTPTATKLSVRLLTIVLLGCLFYFSFPRTVYARPILEPHTAEYTLKMNNRITGSPLTSINGTMSYEIDDECDGWSATQNFQLFYLYNDQNTITEKKYFTNWEAKDGNSLQFASKSMSNNALNEVLRGKASKEVGREGQAIFSVPQNLVFPLDKQTAFPNQYIIEVLEHAQNGEMFFNKIIFDGTDKDGPVEANSFISKKISVKDIPELNNNKNIDKNALGNYAWKIRMAFFPLHNKEILPSHEIDLVLHDNGVVSSSTVLYKSFSISENIKTLTMRPKPDC